MRLLPLVLLLFAQIVGQPVRRAAGDQVVAFDPVLTQLESGRPAVQFMVANNTDQTVTAWEVAVDCTYSDGSVDSGGFGKEAYQSLVLSGPGEPALILPHSAVSARFQFRMKQGLAVTAVRTAVRWAIFADRSAIGSPRDVEWTFQQREREYRALLIVVSALEAGQAAGSGRECLTVAQEVLNNQDQEDYEHPEKRMVRTNLRLGLTRESVMIGSHPALLQWMLERARLQLQAADEHRRPKPGHAGK